MHFLKPPAPLNAQSRCHKATEDSSPTRSSDEEKGAHRSATNRYCAEAGQGANAGEIGRALDISPNTVRTFLSRLGTPDEPHGKLGLPRKTLPVLLVQELEGSAASNPSETLRAELIDGYCTS
jgi:hypothetical protein